MTNNNQDNGYKIIVIQDYSNNNGNPVNVEVTECDSIEDATANYDDECAKTYSDNGLSTRVELWKLDEDGEMTDQIKDFACESDLIPSGSIIVSYKHMTYMNYAYKVVEVRDAKDGERYEDLNYNVDDTMSVWDNVYANVEELTEAYESGSYIFGKLQGGSSLIEEFLNK